MTITVWARLDIELLMKFRVRLWGAWWRTPAPVWQLLLPADAVVKSRQEGETTVVEARWEPVRLVVRSRRGPDGRRLAPDQVEFGLDPTWD